MKLGILGTGKIVQEFLPWLVEHTPFTVQAVCSTPRSAAKAAACLYIFIWFSITKELSH